jgi:hypothetical protein
LDDLNGPAYGFTLDGQLSAKFEAFHTPEPSIGFISVPIVALAMILWQRSRSTIRL